MDFSSDIEKLKAMGTDGEGEGKPEQPPAPSPAEEYAKAKAIAETAETANIAKRADEAIAVKLNSKTVEYIDTSASVQDKIEATAETLVDSGLRSQSNLVKASEIKTETEEMEADFEKNKDAYLHHGIDHKIEKPWQRKILLFIDDVWFVIWAIISMFTIVPVSTFLSRIRALSGLVKWCAVILGVLLAAAILAVIVWAIVEACIA